MQTSNKIPPIYGALKKAFNISWDRGVVIAYEDTIHCKFRITDDLFVHECTHLKQHRNYIGGAKAWYERYIVDKDFRLSQELEAYRNQLDYIESSKDPHKKEKVIHILDSLCGEMYGNMINVEDARKALEL